MVGGGWGGGRSGLQEWGKGVYRGRQVRRSPESKQKKSQVIWQKHSDRKPSVPLKLEHLLLQQVDDQSVGDGLFQNIAWKTAPLVQNPGGFLLLNFLLVCRLVFLNTLNSDIKIHR